MDIVKSSPILESEAKSGLKKFWQGHVLFDGSDYYVNSESWQELQDGGTSKHNVAIPYLTTVKNVGKANETEPLEQAEFELASMVTKQQNSKNYIEAGKKVSSKKLPLPMLAMKYSERAKYIQWPAVINRKYDGNRMAWTGERGQTRGGKPFIPEVVEHFKFDTENHILDGEVMIEGAKLQTSMSAIKRFQKDLSPTLLYYVYDVMDDSLPYEDRLEILKKLEPSFPKNVRLAEAIVVQDEEEMKEYHKQFVLEGFEGTIIRNMNGMYEIGHRSNNLQKYKEFQDQEYKIVEVLSGEGLYSGCAIFVCENENGKRFNSNPEGTLSQKRALFDDRENLIGKWVTIRFFEKSNDLIPSFNVSTSEIRDEDEF